MTHFDQRESAYDARRDRPQGRLSMPARPARPPHGKTPKSPRPPREPNHQDALREAKGQSILIVLREVVYGASPTIEGTLVAADQFTITVLRTNIGETTPITVFKHAIQRFRIGNV